MTPKIDFSLARAAFHDHLALRVLKEVLIPGVVLGKVKVLPDKMIEKSSADDYLEGDGNEALQRIIEEEAPIARGIFGPEYVVTFSLENAEVWNSNEKPRECGVSREPWGSWQISSPTFRVLLRENPLNE